MLRVAILGATGSVGRSAIDVIARNPEHFIITGLAGGKRVEPLMDLALRFSPSVISLADKNSAKKLNELTNDGIEVFSGRSGAVHIASREDVDVVIAAIVGIAGLESVLAAIRTGKTVLLANKESLVVGGELVNDLLQNGTGKIIPIDSEHSSIWHCLKGQEWRGPPEEVSLTASGGPFLNFSTEELKKVTSKQALKHPTWDMGSKITIDSATLMNKGLELIEAHWLFGLEADRLGALIHPGSLVHALVRFRDGGVQASLYNADMRVPIGTALLESLGMGVGGIDTGVDELCLPDVGKLEFYEVPHDRFPSIKIALEALKSGTGATTVLNAANEIAVEAFLQGEINFTAITHVVERVLERYDAREVLNLEDIRELDNWAKLEASSITSMALTDMI